METEQTEQPTNQTLPKFRPVNEYLLCEKIEIDEKVGHIIIADPDKWQKRAKILAVADKHNSFLDDYEEGDVIIYPLGEREMAIQIDERNFFLLKKASVATKVKY